jgi:uncharacterized protein (TIGR02246 family)
MTTETFETDAVDHALIRRIPEHFERAWNTHDMGAFADLLADDVEWINIVGMHWRGKSAVVKAHEVFHRSIFANTNVKVTDISVRKLAPGVAAIVANLEMGDFETPIDVRKGTKDRISFIAILRNKQWCIVHAHNVVIDPAAQPFDPINNGWAPA